MFIQDTYLFAIFFYKFQITSKCILFTYSIQKVGTFTSIHLLPIHPVYYMCIYISLLLFSRWFFNKTFIYALLCAFLPAITICSLYMQAKPTATTNKNNNDRKNDYNYYYNYNNNNNNTSRKFATTIAIESKQSIFFKPQNSE